MTGGRYNSIGQSYSATRREDPRIAAQLHEAIGQGSVLNVGAGTGNYEPAGQTVAAVEPSLQMIMQRPSDKAPTATMALAEELPFGDAAVDVAMAVLTIHHWADPAKGLKELARVASRQVVLFFEPRLTHTFWAIEYFPTALALPTEKNPPGELVLRKHLNVDEVQAVLVPNDCIDGFGTAFWPRPESYLDPEVQAGMSWLAMLTNEERAHGSERLRADLESGEWDRRHGQLRNQDAFDGGYRIAVSTSG